MQIKYNSWDQVPIKLYKEIVEATKVDGDIERNVAVLAVLCDCTEDEIWNLPLPEIGALSSKLKWLDTFDFDRDVKFRKVRIGEYRCRVVDNMAEFTVAQYVDFNNLWSAEERDIAMLLTTFLVPEGKQYNNGYDILDLRGAIEENIAITNANSLCFFFLKSCHALMRGILIYLDYMTDRMRKKMTPEGRKDLDLLRRRIECSFGCLL